MPEIAFYRRNLSKKCGYQFLIENVNSKVVLKCNFKNVRYIQIIFEFPVYKSYFSIISLTFELEIKTYSNH